MYTTISSTNKIANNESITTHDNEINLRRLEYKV